MPIFSKDNSMVRVTEPIRGARPEIDRPPPTPIPAPPPVLQIHAPQPMEPPPEAEPPLKAPSADADLA
jgi:hypothetical protein